MDVVESLGECPLNTFIDALEDGDETPRSVPLGSESSAKPKVL